MYNPLGMKLKPEAPFCEIGPTCIMIVGLFVLNGFIKIALLKDYS